MNRVMRLVVTACLLAAAVAGHAQTGGATLSLVVGVAPGGSLDLVARILAERLTGILKRPVIVENKPGANMLIATKLVAGSAPDGNTLFIATVGPITTNPVFFPKDPVDPLTNLTPVNLMAVGRLAVFVNAGLPARTISELVAQAKQRPGALNFSTGTTTFQVATEMLMEEAGIQLTRIPFNGTAPALTALVAGHVDLAILDVGVALPQLRAGKLRALMVLSEQRSDTVPQVPSAKEAGFPKLEVETWIAAFGPPGLPPEMVNRLNAAIGESLDNRQVRERLAGIDFEVVSYSPEKTIDRIKKDGRAFRSVIEKTGMKAN